MLFIFLPETKQRTFDEIVTSLLRKKSSPEGRGEASKYQYEMDVIDDDVVGYGRKRTATEPVDLKSDLEVLSYVPSIV